MVFKSLDELAPPYLRSLLRKSSQSTSYRLRNTSTDLRLPRKVLKMARNAFRLGVQNFGTASQLTANKQPPSALSNNISSSLNELNSCLLFIFLLF